MDTTTHTHTDTHTHIYIYKHIYMRLLYKREENERDKRKMIMKFIYLLKKRNTTYKVDVPNTPRTKQKTKTFANHWIASLLL